MTIADVPINLKPWKSRETECKRDKTKIKDNDRDF
jgi:hypothetical protein